MAKTKLEYIEYELLLSYLKKAKVYLIEHEAELMDFYRDNLESSAQFDRDMFKLMNGNKLFIQTHTKKTADPFLDILMYVYCLPWSKNLTKLPHFSNTNTWQSFFMSKFYETKRYFGSIREEEGEHFIGSGGNLHLERIVRSSNMQMPDSQYEKVMATTMEMIDEWKSPYSSDTYPRMGGAPLTQFPCIFYLSTTRKRTFFLFDLGVALYSSFNNLLVDEDDDVQLVIPKNILDSKIVGLAKTSVTPEIEINYENADIELHSDKFHTVFDVVSLAGDLADIDNEEERLSLIDKAVASIKAEGRSFPNINSRDFAALSNIIRLYYKDKNEKGILETTLGEMSRSTLSGISSVRKSDHVKLAILDTLQILYKWSGYAIELKNPESGLISRIHVLSYVSDDHTNPLTLANAITSNSLLIGDETLQEPDDESVKEVGGKLVQYKNVKDIKDIPVKIAVDPLFLESIKDNAMNRQFISYYNQLADTNAKAVYGLIETIRKMQNYPDSLNVSYTTFYDAFNGVRPPQIIRIVKNVLFRLQELGAIRSYSICEAYKNEYFSILF